MENEKNDTEGSFKIALRKLIDHIISRKFIVFIFATILMALSYFTGNEHFETIFYGWIGISGGLMGADVVQRGLEK